MNKKTTVDDVEVAKFSQHASAWWEQDGPLKTLHDINPARLHFVTKHVSLSGLSVLDIGCGGGIFSEALARQGARVTGLDVEADALVTARAHAKESNLDIRYVCQPVEVFDAEPFDCITCMELLEHVADPELILQHAHRLLKPGGYLFLSTINRTVKAYATAIVAAEYVFSLLPRQTHDFDKFIRPSELASSLRSIGFEIVGLSGMAYNPFTRVAELQERVDVNYLMIVQRA
jgi:2-polyprenyl-6-hydroxyphenyl methylase/3-demethylubiquinone-9 3-methyltransferase